MSYLEVYLLQHRLIHSHSCLEMHQFRCGLLHGPQCLQRLNCYSIASWLCILLMAEVPPGGVPRLSWAYPWPYVLRCSSITSWTASDASRYTWCTMILFTAMDVSRCIWCSMDLYSAPVPSEVYLLPPHRHNHTTDVQDLPALVWTYLHPQTLSGVLLPCRHPQLTGPSTHSHWSSSQYSSVQKHQWCPGHLPVQAHHHCSYQNVPRHSRIRR